MIILCSSLNIKNHLMLLGMTVWICLTHVPVMGCKGAKYSTCLASKTIVRPACRPAPYAKCILCWWSWCTLKQHLGVFITQLTRRSNNTVVRETRMLYSTAVIRSKLVNVKNYKVCSWHEQPMPEQIYSANILSKIYRYFSNNDDDDDDGGSGGGGGGDDDNNLY